MVRNGEVRHSTAAIVARTLSVGTMVVALACLWLGVTAVGAGAGPLFEAPFVAYDVGGDFSLADLNGDGLLDIASSRVSVSLGLGDGTFAPEVLYSGAGYGPLLAADLNHDGLSDLVWFDGDFNSALDWRLGTGGGALGPLHRRAAGLSVTPVSPIFGLLVTGDFNEDGCADVALSGVDTTLASSNSLLRIFRGSPDGGLVPDTTYTFSSNERRMTVADLNGDGHLDLVLPYYTHFGYVDVLLGIGNGRFGPMSHYGNQWDLLTVAGDVDGDDVLDLVSFGVDMAFLRGVGNGTFVAPANSWLGSTDQLGVVADADEDGKADIVSVALASNSFAIRAGNGDFSFRAARMIDLGTTLYQVVAADVNGDGHLDLALGISGRMALLLGRGGGAYGWSRFDTTGATPQGSAIGDFDGDGHADLAVANSGASTVSLFRGRGDGTFEPRSDVTVGASPYAVACRDVDGDGHLDLVTANYASATVSLLFGHGDGTFAPHVDLATGNQPQSIAIADFDQDGVLDLAVLNHLDRTVSLLRGTGGGAFAPKVDIATIFGPLSIGTGDFDGDGHADLAVVSASQLAVHLGRGDGTFAVSQYTPGGTLGSLVVADENHDGLADVLVWRTTGVWELQGAAGGAFTSHVAYTTTSALTAQPCAGADVDGDGKLDLVGPNAIGCTVLRGAGDGTFGARADFDFPGAPKGIAIGDLDADGRLDVIASLAAQNRVGVLRNALPSLASAPPGPPPSRLAFAPPAPNPALGSTTLRFALPGAGRASVRVYDLAGRRVRTLLDATLTAGPHAVAWDARDEHGTRVAPGLYLVEVRTGRECANAKLVVAR